MEHGLAIKTAQDVSMSNMEEERDEILKDQILCCSHDADRNSYLEVVVRVFFVF